MNNTQIPPPRRGRGRPRSNMYVAQNIYIRRDTLATLRDIAKDYSKPISELAREAIEQHIEKYYMDYL